MLLLLAGRKAEKPSFRKLHRKCTSRDEKEVRSVIAEIGPDSVKLLQSATWFDQLRCVRDSIVHRGGHTLVFGGPSDGILFQVKGNRYQNLVSYEPWMFNSNVVYFDKYAAHLMAHLIVFLEKFASIAARQMGMLTLPDCDARICHDGFTVFKAWIDSALAVTEKRGR